MIESLFLRLCEGGTERDYQREKKRWQRVADKLGGRDRDPEKVFPGWCWG